MEDWFQSGISVATNETNANMYSIVHKTQGEIPVQFTIYDIAGEAFTLRGFENQQLQFEYCEGIIVVIDPSGNPGEESIAIATFINAFKGVKGLSAKKLSDIPVAVIISKADLYKTEIGLPKIKFAYSKNSAQYIGADGQSDIYVARDVICKEFLKNHGFGNVINEIEGTFNNIGVFPVSAMGHGADSTRTYTPWGVTEPVSWLLTTAKAPFPNIIATE
ncbi:hypothetical protein AGMMS49975_09880 [Clostridia bacterium]|nr:hypothetical protein AGMMS49975_09880 [Clostridia bacterium]